MSSVFANCENFNSDLCSWNVSKVEDMVAAFYGCYNFTGKGLDKWDVSNVENMEYMFYDCKKLNCDLSKWDVSKVEDTTVMFYNCNSLKNKPKWYK